MKIFSKSSFAKIGEMSIKGSVLRAIIYTCGHILIAMTCNKLITDTSFELATIDAIVEPIINGFWFFFLDRFWGKKNT